MIETIATIVAVIVLLVIGCAFAALVVMMWQERNARKRWAERYPMKPTTLGWKWMISKRDSGGKNQDKTP